MVKTNTTRAEENYNTNSEHYTAKQTPITTTDKLNNVLNSRTLGDFTYNLDPYKKNPTDSPLTNLTDTLDCYEHTYKILQSLDIDYQRITQSSEAIQTTLERNFKYSFQFS